jgi:hypothetical protein
MPLACLLPPIRRRVNATLASYQAGYFASSLAYSTLGCLIILYRPIIRNYGFLVAHGGCSVRTRTQKERKGNTGPFNVSKVLQLDRNLALVLVPLLRDLPPIRIRRIPIERGANHAVD